MFATYVKITREINFYNFHFKIWMSNKRSYFQQSFLSLRKRNLYFMHLSIEEEQLKENYFA